MAPATGRALDRGRAEGALRFVGPVEDRARLIVSALQDALSVGRTRGAPDRLDAVSRALFADLGLDAATVARRLAVLGG